MANKTIVDLETDLVKPYIDSVKSQLAVGGSVNLAPNYLETTVNNGITWTKNSDGTVTANGTASANSTANFSAQSSNWYLPAGTYKITGCPSGGSSTKYYVRVYNVDSSAVEIARDYGSGDTFTLAARTRVSMTATIVSGQTPSNLVFKPMVTVSTYSGAYVPYAATNEELTERVETLETRVSSLGAFKCFNTLLKNQKVEIVPADSAFVIITTAHTVNDEEASFAFGWISSGQTCYLSTLKASSTLTVDTSVDGKITITSNNGRNVRVEVMVLWGDATVTRSAVS